MAQPDVRVDTNVLDAAGAEVARIGAAIADSVRDSPAFAPEPAWSDGFDSVGATALLGTRWRESLEREAVDVEACGTAMRAAAAAWRAADQAVADSLRAG